MTETPTPLMLPRRPADRDPGQGVQAPRRRRRTSLEVLSHRCAAGHHPRRRRCRALV